MRKMLMLLTCIALLVGLQALAAPISVTNSGSFSAVDNPQVPKTPDRIVDNSDIVIFFDDFESGQGDWNFVDLTDISTTQATGSTTIKQKKMMVACKRIRENRTRDRGGDT